MDSQKAGRHRLTSIAAMVVAMTLATGALTDALNRTEVYHWATVFDSGGVRLTGQNVSGISVLAEPIVHPLHLTSDRLIMKPGYPAMKKLLDEQSGPVSTEPASAPAYATQLHGNYPNPFNPSTTIRFSLAESAPTTLRIFDANGRVVRELVSAVVAAGSHTTRWDGTRDDGAPAASGVYFARMESGSYREELKLVLLK